MKKNIDGFSIFNTALISIVIICISSIAYAVFKYHISGFGTYADFIIAIANVTMALAACLGVKSAKDWLKTKEKEEIFNKKQKIIDNILKFTSKSFRLTCILRIINDKSNLLHENVFNDSLIKAFESLLNDLDLAWDSIVLEKEAIRILSRDELQEDIMSYFTSVKADADNMTILCGRLLDLISWRWETSNLEHVRDEFMDMAQAAINHNEMIQFSYKQFILREM